jgi:hypothetical protein
MRTFTIAAAVLGLALLSGAADAKVKLKVACGTDLEKFCKDVKKGEGRKACLRSHEAELQPSCADELKARHAAKAVKKSAAK